MLLLLALFACDPAPPAACDPLCAQAQAVYAACLASQGLDWTATPYATPTQSGEEGFDASCDAWLWEQQLLAGDAYGRGEAADRLAAQCGDMTAALAAATDDSACETFVGLPWMESL